MLTIKQMAKALNISVTQARRIIADGDIQYMKTGRLIRITQAAVDDYIARNTVQIQDYKTEAAKLLRRAK